MPHFKTVIVGGTFDTIHSGHDALLDATFEAGDEVIIGLSGDEFAASCGKKAQSYDVRKKALAGHIEKRYPARSYVIKRLDAEFGEMALDAQVGALVASTETAPKAAALNARRRDLGVDPVKVIEVPMVMADDGSRISSTRIRRGEIDTRGSVI